MISKGAWNWLIVLATLTLVLGPVVADQFRLEMARWQLAAAANALPANVRLAESRVAQAGQWVDDLTDLRDYWLYRTQRAIAELRAERLGFDLAPGDPMDAKDNVDVAGEGHAGEANHSNAEEASGRWPHARGDVSRVIEQAIAKNPANYTLGLIYASNALFENAIFVEAVEVMEVSCVGNLRKTPYLLNQLAYFRALGSIELDIALEDINQALAAMPDSDAMRDTRAWVLFQMGKPLEALADANFAIEAISRPRGDGLTEQFLRWLEQMLIGRPEPRASDKLLTRREAGVELWQTGALYFHRAKILESLGRTKQAEADFQWLRDHRLPTDNRLY